MSGCNMTGVESISQGQVFHGTRQKEAIVHTFYPAIAAFFESEEGNREYEEWKAKREERKEKKTPAERSA